MYRSEITPSPGSSEILEVYDDLKTITKYFDKNLTIEEIENLFKKFNRNFILNYNDGCRLTIKRNNLFLKNRPIEQFNADLIDITNELVQVTYTNENLFLLQLQQNQQNFDVDDVVDVVIVNNCGDNSNITAGSVNCNKKRSSYVDERNKDNEVINKIIKIEKSEQYECSVRLNKLNILNEEDVKKEIDIKIEKTTDLKRKHNEISDDSDDSDKRSSTDSIKTHRKSLNDNEEDKKNVTPDYIFSIPILKNIIAGKKCKMILKKIISRIEENRITNNKDVDMFDSWNFIVKNLNINSYKILTVALINLSLYETNEHIRNLSIYSARAYMLLLTYPDSQSKRVNLFDSNIIEKCMLPFRLLINLRYLLEQEKITIKNLVDLQIHLCNYLVDLKLVFEHVNLEDEPNLVMYIADKMVSIISTNTMNGYDTNNSLKLTRSAYDVLESICRGKDNKSKKAITYVLHSLQTLFPLDYLHINDGLMIPPDDKSHLVYKFYIRIMDQKAEETIEAYQNFFLKISIDTKTILSERFINFILKYFKIDDYIFMKYYKTSLNYLDRICCNSVDSIKRYRSLKLMAYFLKSNIITDIKIPINGKFILAREAYIFKSIILSIRDKDVDVKTLALFMFRDLFKTQNIILKRIINETFGESIKSEIDNNNIRIQSPSYNFSKSENFTINNDELANNYNLNRFHVSENFRILFDSCNKISTQLYRLYLISDEGIRLIVVDLFRELVIKNFQIIIHNEFISIITKIPKDESIDVRRKGLELLIKLVELYPLNEAVLRLYIDGMLQYLDDSCQQHINIAIESMKVILFESITTFEDMQFNINYRPWIILRYTFTKDLRIYYTQKFQRFVFPNFVSDDVLRRIETHLETINANEAWLLLQFLSKFSECKNTNVYCSAFKYAMFNPNNILESTYPAILDIITSCSHTVNTKSLYDMHRLTVDIIMTGSSISLLGTYLFHFAVKTYELTHTNDDSEEWIKDLRMRQINIIIDNHPEFETDSMRISSLYLQAIQGYTETTSYLKIIDDQYNIKKRLVTYLKKFSNKHNTDNILLNSATKEKILYVIILLSRLSLHDKSLADSLMVVYYSYIKLHEQYKDILNNIIFSVKDLYNIYANNLPECLDILGKLMLSTFREIRILVVAFIGDFLNNSALLMNGKLIFHLLYGLSDDEIKTRDIIRKIFLNYMEKNSESIFREVLLEIIFIINEYKGYQFKYFSNDEVIELMKSYNLRINCNIKMKMYQFLIHLSDLDELHSMFDMIKIIEIEIKSQTYKLYLKNNDETMINDILYCVRKICLTILKKKTETKEIIMDSKDGSIKFSQNVPLDVTNSIDEIENDFVDISSCAVQYMPILLKTLRENFESLNEETLKTGMIFYMVFSDYLNAKIWELESEEHKLVMSQFKTFIKENNQQQIIVTWNVIIKYLLKYNFNENERLLYINPWSE